MRFFLFFLTITLPLLSPAQPPISVDSSLTALQSQLPKKQAKRVAQIRNQLSDSSIYKRMDTLHYAYMILNISYVGTTARITEFYFTHADSVPTVVFENNQRYINSYISPDNSYNSMLKKEAAIPPGISKRKSNFVQEYSHGCLVPRKLFARKIIKARLNTLSVVITMDRTKYTITTQAIRPRRFHPFIVRLTGGKF